MRVHARLPVVWLLLGGLLIAPPALAQARGRSGAAQPAPPSAAPAPPKDALGRDTPRGTVEGFMDAARKANDEAAPLYLNTELRDRAAVDLARMLFVVLDRRLPPRLNELSDQPEGSRADPLKPDQDVVGTITTADGPLDVVVERVNRGASGPVWLFSRQTLATIPAVYYEVNLVSVDSFLPALLQRRVAGVRLSAWLVLFVVFPVGYRLTGLFDRLLRPAFIWWRRRRGVAGQLPATFMPGSARLLVLALFIRWLLVSVELPLLERRFWSAISAMLLVAAVTWALLLLDGGVERYMHRRFQTAGQNEVVAILRLLRRMADVLIIAAAGLVTLHYFGFDPTAALAGLGIGGIAVALAAQKTLENVIGGVSIIFDKAVRVGDFVRLGDMQGAVDYIGLRSTSIRTQDRTILRVPNGQLANVNVETLSARDKFWFHHVFALRLETTAKEMRSAVDDIRKYVTSQPLVDRGEAIRVRFFRLSPFSLDIEVVAYILAGNWELFLEVQQELLLGIIETIERVGAQIALPSQRLFTEASGSSAARQEGSAPAPRRGVSGERAGIA